MRVVQASPYVICPEGVLKTCRNKAGTENAFLGENFNVMNIHVWSPHGAEKSMLCILQVKRSRGRCELFEPQIPILKFLYHSPPHTQHKVKNNYPGSFFALWSVRSVFAFHFSTFGGGKQRLRSPDFMSGACAHVPA